MEKANNLQRSKGRPRIDDRDQILAHFSLLISSGQSVSQIAKDGIRLYRYAACKNGEPGNLEPYRHLQGQGLERRYRKILAEINEAHARISAVAGKDNSRMIGISQPRLPMSFTHDSPLKRGRPKKMRRI